MKRRPAKSNRDHSQKPAATPARPLSRGRLWLFRILALLLLPLLMAMLEVALRVAGYGYPTSFFKESIINGRPFLISNESFTRRFFPPELARWPGNFTMQKDKPDGTLRIFIFGESAAMGDPQPSFGASRYLQVLLQERFPDSKFEIINTGITAINSHVILPIAKDCAKQAGDIWIIYMGNNEMVGPFGAATVFGSRAPPLAAVRFNLAIQKTRTGQLLMSWMRGFAGNSGNTSWGGMQMFLNNQVPPGDARRKTVYENFAANLEAMVDTGLDSGAKVVLSTMSVNLKDCPPFASLNNSNLPAADQALFRKFYNDGIELHSKGDFGGAARIFEQASRIDPQFAELQFRWADCLLRLTNGGAQGLFQAACDMDALPFRADTHINAAIRQVSQKVQGGALVLCDSESALANRSPANIAGDETFFEHVHFNPDGNYALALEWAASVEKLLPANLATSATNLWASQEVCEQRLGLSAWNREFILQSALSRMNVPPLNTQFNNPSRRATLEKQLAALRQQQTAPGVLERTRAEFESAIASAPGDVYLRESFANFLEATGDLNGATSQYRAMSELSTSDYYSLFQLGRLLAENGNPQESEQPLREAARLRPSLPESWVELGKALVVQKKHDEALKCFERAIQLRPRDATYVGYRAQVMSRLGRRAEAIETYRQSIQLNPNIPELHFQLAGELVADNKISEAMDQYQRTLQVSPRHVAARLNLGVLLVRINRLEEAAGQFQTVLQFDPENKTAREYLAQVQAHQTRKP